MSAACPSAKAEIANVGKQHATDLDRSSPEPLHRQLARLLEDAIRRGQFKPGDKLDSESVLTARFGVSRITLRQAVASLVSAQLLVRRQGKGTFVTAPTVRHDLRRLHGLLGSLFSQAEGASARLLHFQMRLPPAHIAAALGLKASDEALSLERIYAIDKKPIAFTANWLDPAVAALSRAKAELISTEDMMHAVGIRIASTEVAIRAEAAGQRIGRHLQLSSRAPMLLLHRTARDGDGVAHEIAQVWVRSDRYQFVCSTHLAGEMPALFDIRNVTESA
jgi:GntR family transcriptional regulator